ncbi:MAG: flagellar basal body-associated FliL family protein [Methylobacteriaceae bacterium]|nr:flagellar basal body-associated FliL family protein [Methylobacteriaceae bacterium]
MPTVLAALVCSCIAIALGAAGGWWGDLVRKPAQSAEPQATHGHGASHAEAISAKRLHDIRPIVTNLAAPAGAWVRVELALVVTGKADPKFDQRVAEFVSDTTDFLRSMTAQQIEGANGLRRLRADLLDRARFRIGAGAESVLIQTLVVQ